MSAQSAGWVRRLLPFLRPHRRNVAIAFAISTLGLGATAVAPVAQKLLIDDVIVHDRRSAAPLIAVLIVIAVVSFATSYVRRYVGGRIALDVQYDLRNAVYEQLQRLDFARHDELSTGQLVSRANADIGMLQALLGYLPLLLGNVVFIVVALSVMVRLSAVLTGVALVVVPVLGALSLRLRTTVFPASWDVQQRTADIAGIVDEAVTGVRVVKGFGQEDRELGRLVDAADELFASRMRAVRIMARYTAALQAVPAVAQVAVLGLGGWLALRGDLTLGTFLAFSTYLVQFTGPIRMSAAMLAVSQQARAGAERVMELLDSTPLVTEHPDAVELPQVAGEIRFEGVSFGYRRSEPVVRGLDLTVAPGETVALVGTSGSGKSTVAVLVPRFYDVQDGAVLIDGTDVRDATIESLRRQIGVVFEESFLFSDTLRSNIAFGRPDATDDEVVAAARVAEAHEFISALPDGYDTVVGERGLTLSGGQRQRIALARALLTDPRVLILDDATSSVDPATEQEIHETLRRVLDGRTTLLIAHRRSTLRLADRIAVMDDGRVVDCGTHDELLERSPLYRTLLAGPGEGAEGDGAVAAQDAVEQIARLHPTADAWRGGDSAAGGGRAARGGHLASWNEVTLAPTPELIAALEALPPALDRPDVDVERETAIDPSFTLRRFTRPYRRPLAVGLGLVALDTLAGLAGPFLVRQGIDHGVIAGSHSALLLATGVLLAITLADWGDMYAQSRHLGRTAERMLFALRVRIFAHLQRLGVDFYDSEMAGRIMTRMTNDVDALATLLQSGLINAVVSVLTFGGVVAVLLTMNVRLALATFVVIPPLVGLTLVFRAKAKHAYALARDRVAAVNADLQESLSGVRVTQAYVREEHNIKRFHGLAAQHLRARLDAQRLIALYFPLVQLLADITAVIVLGYGAHLVHRGSITPGIVIAFLLYLGQFFAPIQQLSQVFDTWQQAQASTAKIDELMAMSSSTPLPDRPVDPGRVTGAISFKGVRFAYSPHAADALRGVDLDIAAGETVALVGQTGAGKSTIVKLVPRFYDPTAGEVLIDGVDLRALDLSAFRRQLGYVPQEPFLFAGTICDNIAYGRPDATDAEVEAAARAVGAHDFIARLPGGYLAEVVERGRSLSAGQRQLVCLARARLTDPAILILDEATANLDLATEAKVQRAMTTLSRGRTTLVIAHRLQTARSADRIVVMADGRVAEQGSHEQLLAAGGAYAALWQTSHAEAKAV